MPDLCYCIPLPLLQEGVSNYAVFLLRMLTSAEIKRRTDFFAPFVMVSRSRLLARLLLAQRSCLPRAQGEGRPLLLPRLSNARPCWPPRRPLAGLVGPGCGHLLRALRGPHG